MFSDGLWIILLEVLLALGLLLFIIWWTMPPAKKSVEPIAGASNNPSSSESDRPTR